MTIDMRKILFLLLFLPIFASAQMVAEYNFIEVITSPGAGAYGMNGFFLDTDGRGYTTTDVVADVTYFFDANGQKFVVKSKSGSSPFALGVDAVGHANSPVTGLGQLTDLTTNGIPAYSGGVSSKVQASVNIAAQDTIDQQLGQGGAIDDWSDVATYPSQAVTVFGGRFYTNKTGVNTTTTPNLDLVNWGATDDGLNKDTISQVAHGFSLGDPVWKSGNYILARDTGLTVRVDGIASEIIDVNTFILQRAGQFTLPSHGFADGIQLYVQVDGSYSIIDTLNALIYGYPIDINTIEIGLQLSAIQSVANKYNDNLSGRGVSTKQQMLDSLAGFQSFSDITSLLSTDPDVGYILEDRNTGYRYKVKSDTVPGFYDATYQQSIGSGKYIVKSNKHDFVFTDANISESITTGILQNTQEIALKVVLTDTVAFNRVITINPLTLSNGQKVQILSEKGATSNFYKLVPIGGEFFVIGQTGRISKSYTLEDNEKIELRKINDILFISSKGRDTEAVFVDELSTAQFENDIVTIRGKLYKTYKSIPANLPDTSDLLLIRADKAQSGENLLTRSAIPYAHGSILCPTEAWNLSRNIRNKQIEVDVLGIDGQENLQGIVPTSGTSGSWSKYIDICNESIQLDNAELLTLSFYAASKNSLHGISFPNLRITERNNSNASVDVISNEESISSASITNKLERFEFQLITTRATQGVGYSPGISIVVNYNVGDTIIFTDVQLERQSSASSYKKTSTDFNSIVQGNDTVYMLPLIEHRILDLDGVVTNSGTQIKSKTIQEALDYCYTSGLCNTVQIGPNTLIDKPINKREGIDLVAKTKTSIDVDLGDSTLTAITFVDDSGAAYGEYQNIRNISFNPISDAYAMVDMGFFVRGSILNCDVDDNKNSLYGFIVGNPLGSGSIYSLIEDCEVKGTKSSGIHYREGTGALHKLSRVDAKECGIGVSGRANLVIDRCDIESNDTFNIKMISGRDILITSTYFETGDFYFENVEAITFKGGRMSLGSFTFGSGIQSFNAENVFFLGVIPLLPNNVYARFVNNNLGSTKALGVFNSYYTGNPFVFRRNNNAIPEDETESVTKSKNYAPNSHMVNSYLEGTITGMLSDSILLDNVTLTGGEENLLTHSDSLGATGTFIRHKVISDTIIDGYVADVLIPTTSFTSPPHTLRSFTLPVSVTEGESLVFSFWAKNLALTGETTRTSIGLILNTRTYDDIIYVASQEWKRYQFTIDSVHNTGTAFTFEISSGTLGDSIAVRNLSLTRGITLRSYVSTGATAVVSTDAKFTINDPDNTVEVFGDIELSAAPNPSGGDNSLSGVLDSVSIAIARNKECGIDIANGATAALHCTKTTVFATQADGTISLDDDDYTTDAKFIRVHKELGGYTWIKSANGDSFNYYNSTVDSIKIAGKGATVSLFFDGIIYHVVGENTIKYKHTAIAADDSPTLVAEADKHEFLFTSGVAADQDCTLETPHKNGVIIQVMIDGAVDVTISADSGDTILIPGGGAASGTYVQSGAGLNQYEYNSGTWKKIN